MAIARGRLVDVSEPGWVHAMLRCVRRAHLAGAGFEHRKQWIEDRLRVLASAFCVEVAAFAVMSNHVHVVLRMRPDLVPALEADDVVLRWCAVTRAGERQADGTPTLACAERLRELPGWVDERRVRLGNLSWFMRQLAEEIARRANAEDGVSGHFWDGRFRSLALVDQAALTACMAYVDLNPFRAGLVALPEDAPHTSLRLRVMGFRSAPAVAEAATVRPPDPHAALAPDDGPGVRIEPCPQAPPRPPDAAVASDAQSPDPLVPQAAAWLQPLPGCVACERDGTPLAAGWRLQDYLDLVDATARGLSARQLAKGGQSVLPPDLQPLLDRLGLPAGAWLVAMGGHRLLHGSFALGHPAARRGCMSAFGWRRSRCTEALFATAARRRPAA